MAASDTPARDTGSNPPGDSRTVFENKENAHPVVVKETTNLHYKNGFTGFIQKLRDKFKKKSKGSEPEYQDLEDDTPPDQAATTKPATREKKTPGKTTPTTPQKSADKSKERNIKKHNPPPESAQPSPPIQTTADKRLGGAGGGK